ncbi:hypothetical protein mRhiFer1_009498 [Rhinolophus ferrumequinum]|uniref:Uncharacterized protein n=1 Tax=Rhinolophus ferrumequinum TaxID=59479 RepID=A0A7J7RF21_RHIFE|nr:hypothetical protein mRhiFer1_009498 [Rhinolophus ferrumequinum]
MTTCGPVCWPHVQAVWAQLEGQSRPCGFHPSQEGWVAIWQGHGLLGKGPAEKGLGSTFLQTSHVLFRLFWAQDRSSAMTSCVCVWATRHGVTAGQKHFSARKDCPCASTIRHQAFPPGRTRLTGKPGPPGPGDVRRDRLPAKPAALGTLPLGLARGSEFGFDLQ